MHAVGINLAVITDVFVSWHGVTWLMSPIIRLISFANFCRIYLDELVLPNLSAERVVLCLSVFHLKVECCGVPEPNLFKYALLKLIR